MVFRALGQVVVGCLVLCHTVSFTKLSYPKISSINTFT